MGFYPVVDVTKLGFFGVRIYLKTSKLRPPEEESLIRYLTKDKRTWWVGKIDGKYSIGVILWVRDILDFHEFWHAFSYKYQGHIVASVISIYKGVYDFNYGFISHSPKKEAYIGSHERTSLTPGEGRVLAALSDNAKQPIIELSKKIGLSPLSVSKAIKSLQRKGVILGFRTRINTQLLGLTHYKVNVWLTDLSKYSEMVAFCRAHPDIIYIDETIGFSGLEFEVLEPSHQKFMELLDEFKTVFFEKISDVSYFIYSDIPKIRYYQE